MERLRAPSANEPGSPETAATYWRRSYEQRLELLSKVTSALVNSLDSETILSQVAGLLAPAFADWCAIDLVAEDGTVRRAGVAHGDPALTEMAKSFWQEFPPNEDHHWLRELVRTRRGLGLVEIRPEQLAHSPPALRELLQRLKVRQAIVTPVGTRERAFGALTLLMAESGRSFAPMDADIASDLGAHIGVALENARLFAAKTTARERISRIAQLTAALSNAVTAGEVAEVTCRVGAEAVQAPFGSLWVTDARGDLVLSASYGVPRGSLAPWSRIPTDRPRIATEVVRTGEGLWLETPEHIAQLPADTVALARQIGVQSWASVPLISGGRVLGVLVIGFRQPQRFTADTRAFFKTITTHAAQALERARLLDAERRGKDRLAVLAGAGAAFAGTLEYEATLTTVVNVALPTLGDFAFLDVVEGAQVRRIAAAFNDEATLARLRQTSWVRSERTDKNLCALSSGKPGLEPDIDDAWMRDVAASPEHLELLRALELRSMLTVPVHVGTALAGALTLCFGRSGRRHDADDLSLAEELARRAGVALAQARLFAQAREAAQRAEEAGRLKDDFLATVSHELRTPLQAIMGWATILQKPKLAPETLSKGVAVIARNAESQARLVEDILDVSRIITGRLAIDVHPVSLSGVVHAALEVVRPSANAKRITMQVDIEADAAASTVNADAHRLQQVVWNLLSNAVKFTPREGHITTSLTREPEALVLRVRDSGEGIAPDVLPVVFERFRQGDSSSTRRHAGLGLGLAIVRHIVELHGGQVRAESAGEGQGATFTVVLPLAAAVSDAVAPVRETAPTGARLDGVRVAVVDDEPDAREALTLVLRDAGAQVTTLSSGRALLDLLAHQGGALPDVLVCDVAMPDLDGYTLLEQLRARVDGASALPAVAVSAYARSEDRERAMAAGFTTHLGKPVSSSLLVSTVTSLARLRGRATPVSAPTVSD